MELTTYLAYLLALWNKINANKFFSLSIKKLNKKYFFITMYKIVLLIKKNYVPLLFL